jgi:hypothetical protein
MQEVQPGEDDKWRWRAGITVQILSVVTIGKQVLYRMPPLSDVQMKNFSLLLLTGLTDRYLFTIDQ